VRKSALLAIASTLSLVGGVVWLVVLVRKDAAKRPSTLHLDSGETVTIEYEADDPYVFSSDERAAIADEARRTIPDVRRALPATPASIVLHVGSEPPDKVMPETGDRAWTIAPNGVAWRVDPSRKEGVVAIARAQLRSVLFHELHHAVRTVEVFEIDIRGHVVCEGLATAFERDFGGSSPPWGQYPAEVDAWTREVLALPKDAPQKMWMSRHPDGRRWIGYRVGTFLVDCAMRASGKTSADLVREPTDAILAMCPSLLDGGSAR
jgi:hypothetical protein